MALGGFVVVVISWALTQTGGGHEWMRMVGVVVLAGVSNGLGMRGPQKQCSAIRTVVGLVGEGGEGVG